MKRQTEWAIIAALILFMSFTPGFAPVRTLLSTAVGRLLGLVAVVYVFKYVSPVIGLLMAIHFARCSRMGSVWEGVDETLGEATEMCECDGGFTYNSGTKMCEKAGAESKKPIRCACIPGEEWDAAEKKCNPKKIAASPAPPPPESMPSAAASGADLAAVQAAAASMPASSVPETTGAAAGATMSSVPPPSTTTSAPPAGKAPEGFAQREKFAPRESMMTRGNLYSPW